MDKKIRKILFVAIADLCFIGFLLFLFVNPWADYNYPMQLPWNVFFVLSADTSGHDSGTGLSILFGFVLPSIIIYIIYFLIRMFFSKRTGKSLNEKLLLLVSCCLFAFSLSLTFFSKHGFQYLKILKLVNAKPSYSEFYEENFVSPASVTLSSSGKTNNLVYIFLESMESSFGDEASGGVLRHNLIPHLTDFARENLSFGTGSVLGGNINLQGTCWTAAGLLSKTLSVPYFLPFAKNNAGEETCLTATKSLYDFLAEQGYENIFAMGSEKQFENRSLILENHSVDIHDITYYKNAGLIPRDYQVFWGFEDQKLYELAKYELVKLSESSRPFSFSMLTVDSHFPAGYKCELCGNDYKSQIENVVACADRQLFDFVSWIREQPFSENTTIVITGDHAYLDAPLNNFIHKGSALSKKEIAAKRRVLDIFINPKADVSKLNETRDFSSYDYMPTILNALGFEFNTKGIALGRSLFKDEPTLVEKYGIEEVENQTMRRTVQYENLK